MTEATLHEELYRSKEAMQKIQELRVLVAGAGALGSNIVESLCRQGFMNIGVIDFDRVENHNLSTQVYGRQNIGQLKTAALVNKIYKDLGIQIEFRGIKLESHNIDRNITGSKSSADWNLIVDAFDNAESRGLLASRTRTLDIPCLHVGISEDGNYSEGVWNENYTVPKTTEDSEICDYPLARNLVSITVGLACEKIVQFAQTRTKTNFAFTFKDLTISR